MTDIPNVKPKQAVNLTRLSSDVRQLSKRLRLSDLTDSFGDTGLKRFGGHIYDEWHQELQGWHKSRAYREMYDNDWLVGMFMDLVFLLITQLGWEVEPAEDSGAQGEKWAKFLEHNMKHLRGGGTRTSKGFKWTISELLLCIPFGFSIMEEIYRRESDGDFAGLLMWDRFSPRSQESIDQWIYADDDETEVIGFTQLPENPNVFARPVPLSKCIHVVYRQERENPEGRSALRNIYTSYRAVKTLRWIEGVAYERNGNGMPTFFVPPSYLSSDAGADQQALVNTFYDLARQMGMDERMGNVLPGPTDEDGEPTGISFEMITAGGAAALMGPLHQTIVRYETSMARALGAEFKMMGTEGSLAMHGDKTTMFELHIDAIADILEDAFNHQSVPRLMRYNSVPEELWPSIRHGKVNRASLAEVVQALSSMMATGSIPPNLELGKEVLRRANIPIPDGMKEEEF